MTTVALGGLELDDSILDGPEGGIPDPGMRSAVERAEREGFGEAFEVVEAWRLLRHDGDTAHVGARSDLWGGWVVLRLGRDRRGSWDVTGSSYGQEVGPSAATRGAGLRLTWPTPSLRLRRSASWALTVLLMNERETRFGDLISPHVFGHVTGPVVPDEESWYFYTDIGLAVDLRPGEHLELAVRLDPVRSEALAVGTYVVTASVPELGLVSAGLTVVVE